MAPLYPEIFFWITAAKNPKDDSSAVWDLKSDLPQGREVISPDLIGHEERLIEDSNTAISKKRTVSNHLVISAIQVNIPIVEGESEEALDRGAWRRPRSSTPDRGGNTVITGHRFAYFPPNNATFYNLGKLRKGDDINVYWNDKIYSYKVSRLFEVESDDITIETDSEISLLTIYTCTPLWTSKRRLVVQANLVKIDSNR